MSPMRQRFTVALMHHLGAMQSLQRKHIMQAYVWGWFNPQY